MPAKLERPNHACLVSSTGRALERAQDPDGLSSRHHPDIPKVKASSPPGHVSHTVRQAPTLGLDRPHPFPQPGLLGRTDPDNDQVNKPDAQHLSVTVRVPPEVTLRDHHPKKRRHRYLYKRVRRVSNPMDARRS